MCGALDTDTKFGVSKEQLRNLISKGKKNFRQKLLAWASAQ